MAQPSTSARGFTLIELLVVVAILSAASLLALGIVTEDRAQIRYDDTRLRLQSLRRAVLGQLGPASAQSIGGFVADNGDLPSDLATLLQRGSLLAQGVQTPVFDPVPDTASCANNGGETSLSESGALLVKGHRGDYLGGLTFNGNFRDGWGNEDSNSAVDALNFGWSVALDSLARSLTIKSLGTDNAVGGSDFATDRSLIINAADWLLPIAGWTVRVFNYSGADLPTRKISASLLVFRNTASGGQWLRYSTPAVDVCLDGTGDGLVGGLPCAASTVLTFSAGCFPADSTTGHDRIPQGRHLLLLVDDADGNPWTADDRPMNSTAWSSLSRTTLTQIDAVAGIALPEARLELR